MRNWWIRFKTAWRMQASFDPLLLERARALIQEIDAVDGSGEYKRHQVYARLLKQYPYHKKSRLALAIEVAKCGL